MIDAVNAVFSNSRAPFAIAEIAFARAEAVQRDDRAAYRADARFAPGLRVVLRAAEAKGASETVEATEAEQDESGGDETALRFGRTRFTDAVARDVAELLESKSTIGGRRIAPSDIAILARRKRELESARRALEAIGIPCVSRCEGDVFDSREAWELASVLSAWLHPGDGRRLRAALSTGAHGWNARALAALGDDAPDLIAVAERHAEYGRIWTRHGFARAFAAWSAREDVAERLAGFADGDRRLANWRHLAELLARIEGERGASRRGLAAWLDRAIADEAVREELGENASTLRLERDDEAVQLVTFHLSKGLEYDVVYLPFLWETFEPRDAQREEVKEGARRPPVRFHDPDTGRRTLDLGADHAAYNEHRALAAAEAAAEHRRLLYVALTRARRLCVVHWGRFGKEYAKSPLARLLLERRAPADSMSQQEFADWATAQPDAFWNEAWQELACSAPRDAIRIEAAALGAGPRWRNEGGEDVALAPIEASRPLALRALATTSFSALVRGAERAGGGSVGPLATGRDLDAEQIAPSASLEPLGALATGLAGDMHLFPRGAEAGTLLHEVLERVDLAAPDDDAVRALAREWLERSGLAASWVDHVVHVVRAVARTPLRQEPRPLRLGALSPGRLLSELEFTLAAPGDDAGRGFSPDALARILADAEPGSPLARYADRAGTLAWPEFDGYLRGFIDAVFFDGERYFLIDYKSNHLGARPNDYLPDHLVAPMIEHDYVLQYLLYTVALDRHLASRIADYDYERHFGGAYYLFLRGLAESHPAGCGIFFDRPEARVVERVAGLLGSLGGGAR